MAVKKRKIEDEKIEYEIIFGNEKIVFIKSGAGGSVRGYADKYFRMAQRIHEQTGATVICASNPDIPHETIDVEEIRFVINEMALSNFELYFIGTSDGAYHNLSLAKQFNETAKWIGINTSYTDVIDLKKRLMALPNVHKVMFHGTEDDDFYKVGPVLSKMKCDNFTLKFVEGADHSFTGMIEEFIALADNLL